MTAGSDEKSQQCHKYFLQHSELASERPQIRTWGRQTCLLPREPSNLVTSCLQGPFGFHSTILPMQGDYDHYARSTAPGRRRRSEASPNKTENTPSPLPSTKTEKNAVQLSPRLSQQAKRQRRTRIKLSKPLIQLPIAVEAGQTRAGQNEWTTRGIAAAGEEKSIDTAGSRGCVAQEEVQETDRTKIPSAANTLSSKFLDRFTELGDGGLEWRQENTALDQFREENENGERKGASSTGASATKGSEKISQENRYAGQIVNDLLWKPSKILF